MSACCQGIPSGPCPYGRRDDSVKFTIYDLFLCPHCEHARENSQLSPQACGDADNAIMSALPSKKGRKAKNISLVNKAQSQSGKILDTATEPITDITAVNDLPNEGGDDDDSCLRCLLRVIRSKRCIKCDICQCTYHQKCIEIPVKVFDKLIANVSITGWVCDECKVAARSSYCRLEAAVAHLTEEL